MVVICVVSVDMLIIYIGKTISEGKGFTKNTPTQLRLAAENAQMILDF